MVQCFVQQVQDTVSIPSRFEKLFYSPLLAILNFSSITDFLSRNFIRDGSYFEFFAKR